MKAEFKVSIPSSNMFDICLKRNMRRELKDETDT